MGPAELTLTVRQGGSQAWLGDCGAVASVSGEGTVAWLPAGEAGGVVVFELAPEGPAGASRSYVGETAVLQTSWAVGDARVEVTDFLPVRLGAGGDPTRPQHPHRRLVRLVEATAGPVRLRFRLAASPGGEPARLVEDPNGVRLVGAGAAVVLQTAGEVVLRPDGVVEGALALARGERRAFLLTWHACEAPEVPEVAASVPDWELDGTFEFWLAWARGCPFRGAQRGAFVRLAALTRAAGLGAGGGEGRLLGAAALAAWGFEDVLPVVLGQPGALEDLGAAAWLLDALAEGYATGLLPPFDWLPQARMLASVADALAGCAARRGPPGPLACAAGLWGAIRLVDEGLLQAEAAPWQEALARLAATPVSPAWPGGAWQEALGLPEALWPPDAAGLEAPLDLEGAVAPLTRLWRIRRALAVGAWLQARRALDAMLLEPVEALPREAWSQALWLGARIHLLEPPGPGSRALPEDLGFD
ncbi:MAG: hypothetical protein VKQ33_13315 [Candidatus Sericytochromatia bacterium]|nr:hypothetical protein [Candidatus Sericytochromatia bacterium]